MKLHKRKPKRNSISIKEEENGVEQGNESKRKLKINVLLNDNKQNINIIHKSKHNHPSKHNKKKKKKKKKITKEESDKIKTEKYVQKIKEFSEKSKKAKQELRKQKILKACKTGFGLALIGIEIVLLIL